MDELYKNITRTLEEARGAIIKGSSGAAVELVDKAITMHKQLEKRVYVLEMERANEKLDIGIEQLIVHPLHNNIKKN